MEFCHSCGLKVNSEEVFCSNCGIKLVKISENESKQATQVNVNQQQSREYKASPNLGTKDTTHQSNNTFNNVNSKIIGDIFIKMLMTPVLGAKEFVEKGKKNSVLVVTLILAIMQGLLGIWKVKNLFYNLENMSIKFIQSFAKLISKIDPSISLSEFDGIHEITSQISQMKSFINIPYGRIFLQNSFLFLLSVLIIFTIVYLAINILSKNKHEPFLIYKTALIVLIPILYFEFFSIVISYLSFFLALGVAIIGVIISLGCLIIVLKEKVLIDENNSVFIVSISFVLLSIVILICLQNFLVSNLTDVINSIKNVNDILN